jgi:MFS transporter, OFA family, oxalate/formate antiporter
VAGLMVIGILQPFVSEQLLGSGLEMTQAAAVGTAAVGYLAVFNALGRVIWGLISDRLGRTAVFIGVFTIQALVMFLLGHLNSALALCVAAAAVGFNYGGKFALFPSATSDFFGAKNLGANYGWLFTSYGIAGVVGITAGNAARVLTGSYVAAFTIAGVLCLISAALALFLRTLSRPSTT